MSPRAAGAEGLTPGAAVGVAYPDADSAPGSRVIRVVDRPAETIGARIARFRMAQEWTQEELALEAGLSQSTISLIEASLKEPLSTTLYALAGALGVDVDDIWLGEEEVVEVEPHAYCPAVLGCRTGRLPVGWVRERKEVAS